MVVNDRGRTDDYWAALARKEGYPARSVYKLKEIDGARRILGPSHRVLDLGASPGSWTLYAAQKARLVCSVDLEPLAIKEKANIRFFQLDVLGPPPEDIVSLSPFQAVLSDLAPKTTGQKAADSDRSLALAGRALDWAERLLGKDGSLVFKVFQGGGLDGFLKGRVRPLFAKTLLTRPKAVRKQSPEIYCVCLGFKGQ